MSDTLLTQPSSSSLLQTTKYQLSFKRLPAIVYFCQKVNLPGTQLLVAEQPTPFRIKPIPGNKIQYEELTIEFLLEEEMITWNSIHIWMKGLGLEKGFQDYINLKKLSTPLIAAFKNKGNIFSDATLTTLTTQNNPKNRFVFTDCFPTSLSSVDFDSTKDPSDIMTCTATFAFEYYDLLT